MNYFSGSSKMSLFSAARPWRLFHPPVLSPPRQTLRPWTHLGPCNAAVNYPFLRGCRNDPNCAHRTSTVSPCAFCEQGGYLAAPSPYFRDRALREHRRSSASTPSFQHPVRLNTERSASPQSLCQNSTAFEFLKKTTRGFKGPYHFTQRVLAELQDGAQRP